ncbi:MAG: hypothetical protein H0T90_10175, partial [Gemmatimonadales bacterium]|nr:hypothetical protein [Gemmatimonadales bacterium]
MARGQRDKGREQGAGVHQLSPDRPGGGWPALLAKVARYRRASRSRAYLLHPGQHPIEGRKALLHPLLHPRVQHPVMARGRWYPTLTTLGNGRVVALAGRDQTSTPVLTPELWTGSGWRKLSGASLSLPYYPRTFLAPNGRVFYAGELQRTYYLRTSNAGSWTYLGDRRYRNRDYGS